MISLKEQAAPAVSITLLFARKPTKVTFRSLCCGLLLSSCVGGRRAAFETVPQSVQQVKHHHGETSSQSLKAYFIHGKRALGERVNGTDDCFFAQKGGLQTHQV